MIGIYSIDYDAHNAAARRDVESLRRMAAIADKRARKIQPRASVPRSTAVGSMLLEHAKETLKKHGGNTSAAARELGVDRVTVYRWKRKFWN